MQLLEIEKELGGPDGENALRRHDDVLVALEGRLRTAMAEGLPPDLYEKCEPLGEAVTVARKLLRLQLRGARKAI